MPSPILFNKIKLISLLTLFLSIFSKSHIFCLSKSRADVSWYFSINCFTLAFSAVLSNCTIDSQLIGTIPPEYAPYFRINNDISFPIYVQNQGGGTLGNLFIFSTPPIVYVCPSYGGLFTTGVTDVGLSEDINVTYICSTS